MGSSENHSLQFFTVFQPQFSSHKMMIPVSFAEKIAEVIPGRVFIKSRSKSWLVDVEINDGRLYLGGGWAKFVSDNSLKFGEFLVFKYNGNHIFNVIILGRNGYEKLSIEDEALERMHTADCDEDKHEDDSDARSRKCRKVVRGKNGFHLITKEEARQIARYLPKKNPFFLARLRKSALDNNRLLIPKGTITHSHLKLSDTIFLQDAKERTWAGKKCVWDNGQTWLMGGWKHLCKSNKVEYDDIILGEFLPQNKRTCTTIKFQIIKPSG